MLTDISFGRTSGRHHLVRLNDLHCWLADLFITSSDSTFAYRGPRRCSLRIFTGQKLDPKTIVTSPSRYMHVPGVPRSHAGSIVVLVKLQGLGNCPVKQQEVATKHKRKFHSLTSKNGTSIKNINNDDTRPKVYAQQGQKSLPSRDRTAGLKMIRIDRCYSYSLALFQLS